jgi:hypothetical protein
MTDKTKSVLVIFSIIIGLCALRLFKVTEIPAGLYWDEAAIAYNAFGIADWNRDEWGNKLPISFRSFGDYKAPLLIYVLSVPYKLFGLHIDWLRYLAVLIGTGNVLFTLLIFKKIVPKANSITLITFLVLVGLSPWYFHFSRFGNEASLSLFLILAGSYYFLKAQAKPFFYLLSSLLLSLSLYAYHSAKFFTPLLVLVLLSTRKSKLIADVKYIATSLFLGVTLLIPLAIDSVTGSGFERGKSLIIFEEQSLAPSSVIFQKAYANTLSFLSLDFWIFGRDSIGARHGLDGFGVLLQIGIVLTLVGVYLVVRNKHYTRFQWIAVLGLLGIMPSLLSHDAPHAIRSMLSAPWFLLLAGLAIHHFSTTRVFTQKFRVMLPLILATLIIESGLYLNTYFTKYPQASAPHFQYGYQQAFEYIESHKYDADTFVITDKLGQPYIYTLLYRGITPEEFKFGALANYEFHEIDWPDDRKRRMYVATPQEIPPTDPAVVKIIPYPNSTEPALVIALN